MRENETDRELDRLLQQAQWPEIGTDSARRLTDFWSQLTTEVPLRRSMFIGWRSIATIAASILILVTGALMFGQKKSKPLPAIAAVSHRLPEPQSVSASSGRAPTQIEMAMLHLMDRQTRGSRDIVPRPGLPLVAVVSGWTPRRFSPTRIAPPEPVALPVEGSELARQALAEAEGPSRAALLDRLVELPPQSAAPAVLNLLADTVIAPQLIDSLVRHPTGWSDVLLAALNDPHVQVRSSASTALSLIDGPVITGRLIAMVNTDVNRHEAINTLVRIDSDDARNFLAAAEQSSQLSGIVRSAIAQVASVHPAQEFSNETQISLNTDFDRSHRDAMLLAACDGGRPGGTWACSPPCAQSDRDGQSGGHPRL